MAIGFQLGSNVGLANLAGFQERRRFEDIDEAASTQPEKRRIGRVLGILDAKNERIKTLRESSAAQLLALKDAHAAEIRAKDERIASRSRPGDAGKATA